MSPTLLDRMATAVARRRREPSTDELVRHTDHVSIGLMLDRIDEIAASSQWNIESGVADLERAFRNELALLHEHVTSQIGLEEALAARADEHEN